MPTQPIALLALSGRRNQYWPKCVNSLQLRSKDRDGLFHLFIKRLGGRYTNPSIN